MNHNTSFAYLAFSKTLQKETKRTHCVIGGSSSKEGKARPKTAGHATAKKKAKEERKKLKERELNWNNYRSELPVSKTRGEVAGSGFSALRHKAGSNAKPPTRSGKKPLGNSKSEDTLGSNNTVSSSSSSSASPSTKKSKLEKDKKKFAKLCENLVNYWQELYIPMRDREYFYRSFCQKLTDENITRILAQLELVQNHRNQTINVLNAIQNRENQVASLKKQCVNIKVINQHNKDILKTALTSTILAIQQANVSVIENINQWRKNLWRPQPFVFQGMNYLLKVNSDTRFIIDDLIIKTNIHEIFGCYFHDPLLLDIKFDDLETNELQSYINEVNDTKLNAIKEILSNELKLQHDLRVEHKKLLKNGYYIPALRWSPADRLINIEAARAEFDRMEINTMNQETLNSTLMRQASRLSIEQHEDAEAEPDLVQEESSTKEDEDLSIPESANQHADFLKSIKDRVQQELQKA